VTLYLYIYTAQLLVSVFLQVSNPGMHAGRPPQPLSTFSHRRPGPNVSGACGQGLWAAYQHAARHLLLSLTRQWLVTERHLTQY